MFLIRRLRSEQLGERRESCISVKGRVTYIARVIPRVIKAWVDIDTGVLIHPSSDLKRSVIFCSFGLKLCGIKYRINPFSVRIKICCKYFGSTNGEEKASQVARTDIPLIPAQIQVPILYDPFHVHTKQETNS